MKRQRDHINESNLDTLAVTCTVYQQEIVGESWQLFPNPIREE